MAFGIEEDYFESGCGASFFEAEVRFDGGCGRGEGDSFIGDEKGSDGCVVSGVGELRRGGLLRGARVQNEEVPTEA